MGIGLALVGRILQDHDGRLDIRRMKYGGTEALVELPPAGLRPAKK